MIESRLTTTETLRSSSNSSENSVLTKPFPFVTTAHKDVAERLQVVNPQLYGQVRHVLELNKAQRHIRGGQATRRKYKGD
ncbi:MAG: sporulation transcriptional regulator SpoIIID [Clostridia bacterium]|nr:sporulation transcriptional regulator SpoIIID [Clostridia bacterium]